MKRSGLRLSRSFTSRVALTSCFFATAAVHGQCPTPGFTGLGDLPGGLAYSIGTYVSADGSTVVGYSKSAASGANVEAFRWRSDTGMVALGAMPYPSYAYGVSADGSLVVGETIPNFEGWRWTSGGGVQALGCAMSGAYAISNDGITISGLSSCLGGDFASLWTESGGWQVIPGATNQSRAEGMSRNGQWVTGNSNFYVSAFRRSQATGWVELGELPGGSTYANGAGISDDGEVVVGFSESSAGPQGFMWTPSTGMVGLGDFPGGAFYSYAQGVNADGTIIVGSGGSTIGIEAAIWINGGSIERLADVLADNGVAVPCGWTLRFGYNVVETCGIITIVGYGTNPNGDTEAFMAGYIPGSDPVSDCNGNATSDECDIADCSGDPDCGDCNANLIPDGCERAACAPGDFACQDCNRNGLLDSCDLDAGVEDLDSNSVPDHCYQAVSVSAPEKTRFISFAIPAGPPAPQTALRVTLSSLHHVDPPYTGGLSIPFTSFEGQVRWVGPPTSYMESTSVAIPFFASQLQCGPHYRDWSTVGLLHVTGSAIVPSSVYEVENVSSVCTGVESTCVAVSASLQVVTTRWGDVAEAYNPPAITAQPDVADIAALVAKFRSLPTGPIKARALLAGDDSFGNINSLSVDFGFTHIAACVDAFRGKAYPHAISSCP